MENCKQVIDIESIKSIVSQRLCKWNDRVRDFEFVGETATFRTYFLTDVLLESLFGGICRYGFSAVPSVSVLDSVVNADFMVSVYFFTTMPVK